MSNVGKQADFLHGIPVVANSAERDARFPTPDTNQRVANLATGYIERYTGSFWAQELPLGNAGPIVYAKAKGATGDGTTDDTGTLQAMLTAAGNSGHAHIASGTYKTSAPLNVTAVNLTLSGPPSSGQNGCAAVIINTTGGPILNVTGAGVDPTFTIRNIGLIGDHNVGGGAGATVDGINFVGDAGGNLDSTVHDCSFLGLRKPIIAAGRNLQVYDNTFANCQKGVQIEAALGANRAFKIKRNLFHGMGNADADADIYVNDPAAYNITVEDNYRDEGARGRFFFAVSGVDRVRIANNRLDRVQNNAIELGTASNVDISDNFIYGEAPLAAAADGIVVGAITSGRISNNHVIRVWHNGISVNAASTGLSVTGNTVIDAGQAVGNTYDAIALTPGGSKGHVSGNTILNTSSSTRYGINGGAGWALGINYVTSNSTAAYNGAFDSGTPSFGNTIFANKVGGQVRLLADGTAANDAGLFVDGSGNIFLSNWNANRGVKMFSTGEIATLGGSLRPGNFGTAQSGNLWMGSGVPSNANGNNGDAYLRTDTPGTVNQRLYVKSAGAWVGIL